MGERLSQDGTSSKKPSPQSSPKGKQTLLEKPASTPDQTGAAESYATAAKQQYREKLPEDIKNLREKYSDLFKKNLKIEEQQTQTVIPYYADVSTNKYSVLRTKDSELDDSDPYNMAVADFVQHADEG